MENYDFIVIGAGVSGLAASMYAARLGLKTLCLGTSSGSEVPIGGVITTTNIVENYPGFISISGADLGDKMKKHAESYDLVTIKPEKVEAVNKIKEGFEISTKKGKYRGKTILFATGTVWKKLDVPGSKEFENRGVAYCALCDAPLFKNKIVAVVGGSDSAAKEALILSEQAKKVYIIYRKEKIRAEPINVKRVDQKKNIEIINNANVLEILGDKAIRKVKLDREFNGSNELNLDGLFIAIGHVILSDLAKSLGVNTNDKGEIIINHKSAETNIKGVYAAGDVTDKPFKQAITGVSDGCIAAYSAFEFITKSSIS
jgi:thioredoxin reductase (NADPH)